MTIQTGTQLGAYEILSPLGAGGMGEVHRARDTRLNREVAIKVLPADFANDAERLRRFEQEALATSALNHPNILTIYEFGSVSTEAGATHFLASEFIDGETLRNRLQRAPLTLNEAIDIAVQTAQALAAAHEANIIHRDIKPENVMLRKDGIVKVLDFGLAKLTEVRNAERRVRSNEDDETLMQPPPATPQSTLPGTVMGTVAYMSPEQARGQTVDARTDLFSLGVMLYEMLARRQPFTGETVNHVIVAILEQEPPLLTGVPAELTRILAQALAKQADERYGSAHAMLADLKKLQMRLLVEAENKRNSADDAPVEAQTLIQPQVTAAAPEALATAAASAPSTSPDHAKPKQWWLAAGLSLLLVVGGYFGYGYFTAARQIESIAVMPFVNASGNADVEYLSDGMTETLISSLSQLPKLNVKPRSSVFRYKGKDTNPNTIAKELNVQAILNGRVVQRGQEVSLFVELIEVALDKVVWSEHYNRKQTDLVTLQSDIARDVSSKLKTKLSGAEVAKVEKTHTANPEAYQLYLQGRYHWNKREIKEFEIAVKYFKQAIEKDPNYVLAYAGLADTYALFPLYGNFRPKDYYPQAKLAARKALELDDNLAEAHSSLGRILLYSDFDFVGGEREYRRAIQLDPKYATAHHWLGELLTFQGRHDESIQELKKALELDPFSNVINLILADYLVCAQRYAEALTQYKKTIETFPDDKNISLYFLYAAQGKYPEAVASWLDFAKRNEVPKDIIEKRKAAYEKNGWEGFQQADLESRLERAKIALEKNKNASVDFVGIATTYAELKDKEKTLEYLNKAYEERLAGLLLIKADPLYDFLRDDPRFKGLLNRMNLPE